MVIYVHQGTHEGGCLLLNYLTVPHTDGCQVPQNQNANTYVKAVDAPTPSPTQKPTAAPTLTPTPSPTRKPTASPSQVWTMLCDSWYQGEKERVGETRYYPPSSDDDRLDLAQCQ